MISIVNMILVQFDYEAVPAIVTETDKYVMIIHAAAMNALITNQVRASEEEIKIISCIYIIL